MLLEKLTWPEVKKLKLTSKVVVLPLRSFEQRGPHLPLTTDTDIVTAVARGIERKRPDKGERFLNGIVKDVTVFVDAFANS